MLLTKFFEHRKLTVLLKNSLFRHNFPLLSRTKFPSTILGSVKSPRETNLFLMFGSVRFLRQTPVFNRQSVSASTTTAWQTFSTYSSDGSASSFTTWFRVAKANPDKSYSMPSCLTLQGRKSWDTQADNVRTVMLNAQFSFICNYRASNKL